MSDNVCPRCGAPLPIASFGAAVQCKFCAEFAPPPFNTDPVVLTGGATQDEIMAALQHGTGVRIIKDPERAAVWKARIERVARAGEDDARRVRRVGWAIIGLSTLIALVVAAWVLLRSL